MKVLSLFLWTHTCFPHDMQYRERGVYQAGGKQDLVSSASIVILLSDFDDLGNGSGMETACFKQSQVVDLWIGDIVSFWNS